MNVMLMSVYERVKRDQTIAAIGAYASHDSRHVRHRGVVARCAGHSHRRRRRRRAILVIGAMGPTFNFGRETGLVLSPQVDLWQMLVISAVVLLVAVVGTVQPAFKASRMEPVEALRHG
jgi:putative ABC transport system permease protein